MLVQGARPDEIIRQYMAKGDSPTRGRELNIHYGDLVRGFIGQISHLGDMVPVMAGVTLSRLPRSTSAGDDEGDAHQARGRGLSGLVKKATQRLQIRFVSNRVLRCYRRETSSTSGRPTIGVMSH